VRRQIPIVGLQRLSLIDYPGKLCATLFTAGCNFRCPYCYNVDIVLHHEHLPIISEREVLDLLDRRRGFLDGLCVGGGEPTLHRLLPIFLSKVKALGILVKLDTNGSKPRMLRKLIERGFVDYVAMDVKAPLQRYPEVVRFKVDINVVKQSIRLLKKNGVDYEFRTTVVPGLLDGDDIEEIAQTLTGTKRYVLQQFKPRKTLCPEIAEVEPYSVAKLRAFCDRVRPYFGECKLRL